MPGSPLYNSLRAAQSTFASTHQSDEQAPPMADVGDVAIAMMRARIALLPKDEEAGGQEVDSKDRPKKNGWNTVKVPVR